MSFPNCYCVFSTVREINSANMRERIFIYSSFHESLFEYPCISIILSIIRIAPIRESLLRVSPKQIQPSMPAPNGPNAQYNPAVSEEVYFCATGCSVKPKQLHTSASNTIASHSTGSEGRRGDSNTNDETEDKMPIIPN